MNVLFDLQQLLTPLLLGMDWMDPDWLLDRFGEELFWLSLAIIFVECGLFFPFLPGDSLLFAMGLFIAGGKIDIFPGNASVELLVALGLFAAAGFLGNVAGYEIGRAIGTPLYNRPDGRILKRKYFDQTQAFFDKHGNKALVIGRFVPFVRTYITVVAGVTKMDRRRFFTWSAVGAVLWVFSITLLGYFLGTAFPALGENIDKAIIAIIAFSVVPIAWEWWRHKRVNAPGAEIGPQDGGPDRDIMGQEVD
ncbi:DedA family protein [Nocardioides campestrisoli]|uniref:DedA family protein n=1 Tax=Nocardioides campestrisoli TaxID=2736757 RepID=UPI0028121944|nr:VTT domain-containing protein [Nocardioides campestrisoli]